MEHTAPSHIDYTYKSHKQRQSVLNESSLHESIGKSLWISTHFPISTNNVLTTNSSVLLKFPMVSGSTCLQCFGVWGHILKGIKGRPIPPTPHLNALISLRQRQSYKLVTENGTQFHIFSLVKKWSEKCLGPTGATAADKRTTTHMPLVTRIKINWKLYKLETVHCSIRCCHRGCDNCELWI